MRRRMLCSWFVGIAVFIVIGVTARGQEPLSEEWLLGVDETLVTATKHEQKVSEAPGTVEVFTARELLETGALTIADALRYVTSIRVIPEATGNIIEVRGVESIFGETILLLIDGRPANTPFYGGLDIDFHNPISLVKQIEFIKGPGSALYGANAYAGVINIITYSGAEIGGVQGLAQTSTVSREAFTDWLYGGVDGNLDYAVSFNAYSDNAEDFSNTSNPNRANRNTNGRIKLQWPGYKLEVSALDGDNPMHGSMYIRTPPTRKDTKGYVIGVEREAAVDTNTNLKVRLSINRRSRRYDIWAITKYALGQSPLGAGAAPVFFPDPALTPLCAVPDPTDPNCYVNETALNAALQGVPGFDADYQRSVVTLSDLNAFGSGQTIQSHNMKETLTEGELQWDHNFSDSHLLTLGFAARFDKLSAPDLGPGTENGGNWAFYLQDIRKPTRKLSLTLGMRYDKHDVYGANFSPRISLLYTENENLSYKFSFGSAFRAPNLFEMYGNMTYLTTTVESTLRSTTFPLVQPEEINTYEFNVNLKRGGKFAADLNLYHLIMDKDIVSPPYNGTLFIQDDLGLIGLGAIFPSSALAAMPGSGIPATFPLYIIYRNSAGTDKSTGAELELKGRAGSRLDWWAGFWYRHENLVNPDDNRTDRWHNNIDGLNWGLRWQITKAWFLRTDTVFSGVVYQPDIKDTLGYRDKHWWRNGSQSITDITFGAEWRNWTVTLTGRNIFGHNYLQDFSGDPNIPSSRAPVTSDLDPQFSAMVRWNKEL